jgi:hypothetical protein
VQTVVLAVTVVELLATQTVAAQVDELVVAQHKLLRV